MTDSPIPMPVTEQRMGTRIDGQSSSTSKPTQLAPGALIALNMEKCVFLGAPDGSFFLNASNPSTRIPFDVSEEVLHALQGELRLGKIIMGDTPQRPAPSPALIESFLHAIDKAEIPADLKEVCKQASGTHRMGLTPLIIYEEMIKYETVNQCRPDIINYISQFIRFVGGPSGIEDSPADEVQVTLPVGADGSVQVPRTEEQSETLKDLI